MTSLRVCLAHDAATKEKMHRLRYETYTTELCSFNREQFANGLETDKYDEYSVHIVALAGEEVVGTLRLVKDSVHGFVMESAFELPPSIDRAKAVEHSRGIVRKDYRDRGLYRKLLECAYGWQRENGFPICLGAPNVEKLRGILLALGWTDIGEPKCYHNITVVPMIYRLA